MMKMSDQYVIYIGFDAREVASFAVCKSSIKRHLTLPIQVKGLVLDQLRTFNLYYRPTEWRVIDGNHVLYDVISEHPMSTEFAISRFLTPLLTGRQGWAVFMDADMLVLTNMCRLFDLVQPDKAVMVVKHQHEPIKTDKKAGQVQSQYFRKNWSSLMLFNCAHPKNRRLTVDLVNTRPGRDLHRFCWLDDEDIGELEVSWNWLVGHSPEDVKPNIVHFTDGTPNLKGYENQPYAKEWWSELQQWAT